MSKPNSAEIKVGSQIFTNLRRPYIVTEIVGRDSWNVLTATSTAMVTFNGRDWYLWPNARGVFPRQIQVMGVVAPQLLATLSA
jgi:hypothetical protein